MLFVIFNVTLFGVFASRGIKPMLSAARQLYNKLYNKLKPPVKSDNSVDLTINPVVSVETTVNAKWERMIVAVKSTDDEQYPVIQLP